MRWVRRALLRILLDVAWWSRDTMPALHRWADRQFKIMNAKHLQSEDRPVNTGADFYVGRGETAEWVGSISTGGNMENIRPMTPFRSLIDWPAGASLFEATTDEEFRARVRDLFENRGNAWRPVPGRFQGGWPHDHDDSSKTAFSYAFDAGAVYVICFGHKWYPVTQTRYDSEELEDAAQHATEREGVFPRMR